MDSKRLEERQVWDVKYAEYLAELDKQKPVLATGDYNVAHKGNRPLPTLPANRRSPGFTDEEREGFTNLLAKGFYRYLPPPPRRCTGALHLVGTTQQDFKKSTIQAGESTIG